MIQLLKEMFKKKPASLPADIEVKEKLKYIRADGVYPAEEVHSDLIFQEIIKGAGAGCYYPALYEQFAHKGLKLQILDTIQTNSFNAVSDGKLKKMDGIIKVIYQDGEASGFYWSMTPSDQCFEIYMLSVREQNKQMGLGKKLMLDALSTYSEGSEVVARVYKSEYKVDQSNAMQKILKGMGFKEALVQEYKHTTQFEKTII